MVQEAMRRHVLRVLRVWRLWSVFSDDFLNGLQVSAPFPCYSSVFTGLERILVSWCVQLDATSSFRKSEAQFYCVHVTADCLRGES